MKKARMKSGHKPIIIGGAWQVPAHPEYWEVPDSASAAVQHLVDMGQIEYAPHSEKRNGRFARKRDR